MRHINLVKCALLILLFLPSCKAKFTEPCRPIDSVFQKHERMQLRKYHMKLVAAGIPEEDEIEQAALHYVAFKKMKIPQVRELVVSNVEEFLHLANHHEKVASQLKHPPLTFQNIKFNVGFGTTEGGFQEPPYIAYAYLDEGTIYYCYHDRYFHEFTEEEEVSEPYESAKAAVIGEKEGV